MGSPPRNSIKAIRKRRAPKWDVQIVYARMPGTTYPIETNITERRKRGRCKQCFNRAIVITNGDLLDMYSNNHKVLKYQVTLS
jgi:hypothetical protein